VSNLNFNVNRVLLKNSSRHVIDMYVTLSFNIDFSTTPKRTKEVRVNIQPNSTCALIATVKYWRLFTDSMLCSKDRLQGVCSVSQLSVP
jgi:hypothetical protein